MNTDYITLLIFLLLIVFLYFYVFVIAERRRNRFELKAWGEIDRVISIRGKTKVHLMTMTGRGYLLLYTTISTIFFKDGTSVKVLGINNFPPPGTHIKVYKNKIPEFRIEIDPMPPSSCL